MKTKYPKMHVSLYVKNLDDSIRFYSAFFNQEAAKVEHRYAKFILDEPALIISFIEAPEKVKPYNGHLGIQVDSVDELKARLALINKSEIKTLEENQTSCCYALQDKFWVNDPDGVSWEIYYFHSDVKFNDPNYELKEKEEACCTSDAEIKNSEEACCNPKAEEGQKVVENSCC